MEKHRHWRWVLPLGLVAALGACSDDDGDDGEKFACEGQKAALIGSCLLPSGICYESRGELAAWDGLDLEADCVEEDGGTWSTGACPAASKVSGGCVVEVFGAVSVSYHPTSTPEEVRAACESIPFDPCVIPAPGGGGGGDKNGSGDTCDGLDLALVGSCDYAEGICLEYRGDLASQVGDLQQSCEFNTGAVWSTTAGCPADAKAAGACVMSVASTSTVVYHSGYTPAEARQDCEATTGDWCYQAP